MKTIIKSNLVALALIFALTSASAQQISDKEMKKNVTPLTSASSYLAALEPLMFEYDAAKTQGLNVPEGVQYGFTAEEVEKFAPHLVKTQGKFVPAGKNAFRVKQVKTVDYQKLIPLLAGALREQQAELQAIRKELAELKAKK